MTAEWYIDLLSRNLKRIPRLAHRWFQHDGAPSHTSTDTKDWLRDYKNVKVVEWPSRSPDLNLIENIFGVIKKRLKAEDRLNVRTMRAAITNIFFGRFVDAIIPELYNTQENRYLAMQVNDFGWAHR